MESAGTARASGANGEIPDIALQPLSVLTSASDVWEVEPARQVAPPLDTASDTVPADAGAPPPVRRPPEADPNGHPVRSARYVDRGLIGLGGMGEVRRVEDRRLRRAVAMKVLRPEYQRHKTAVQRFLEEAQVAAQLAHPNIVPVHDVGQLDDGRAYFTMDEVRGKTLGQVIKALHQASPTAWGTTEDGWTLRRLLEAFRHVCDAVAYAHARGVLHRDLKPDNVMLGSFGEVLVMDWGLAKVRGVPERLEPVFVDVSKRGQTRAGAVAGTPAYMAPEQARGEHDQMDQRADVYALGALLYEILDGRCPYRGKDALKQVLAGPPRPLDRHALGRRKQDEPGPPIPSELRRICAKAMARSAWRRYADAAELEQALEGWLDGSRRRQQALALVAESDALAPEVERLQMAAHDLRERARVLLAALPPAAPVEDKHQAWALQQRAETLEVQAELRHVAVLEKLRGALNEAPDTPEAHDRLAAHYVERHRAAEQRRDARGQAALETLLRTHDTGRWEDYLRGEGLIRLITDRPARASLRPLREIGRRLVPGDAVEVGPTPLSDVRVPHGTWLVELTPASGPTLRIPVHVERLRRADVTPPGETIPERVVLPTDLSADEAWVAAGWASIGGDPLATGAGPRRRVWVDAFIMQRDPVTHADYLRFLADLTARDGLDAALRHAPRVAGLPARGTDGLRYALCDGHLALGPDLDPDGPVSLVDWTSASAYAAWLSARTGLAWRLPAELEWEKAARGVDGRFFPWGDAFDPAFCRVRAVHRTARAPDPVHAWPSDESVYGVRGLAGNARDWCLDAYCADGPAIHGDRAVLAEEGPADARAVRGGSWSRDARSARAAARDWEPPAERSSDLGFRLVRPVVPSRG